MMAGENPDPLIAFSELHKNPNVDALNSALRQFAELTTGLDPTRMLKFIFPINIYHLSNMYIFSKYT